ncbi:glycosyl hydrolase family 8 [Bosea sp. 117]|uniref:glycosyl hydrolase family 8 n=1 Tax=Bosea sp. 117 TaxID=1125973 RepID=UPI0004940521|nr:glycosyl hydrolase family 8 [Bosea sp. 117]
MRHLLRLLIAAMLIGGVGLATARAQTGTPMVSPNDWKTYVDRFVDPSGRVIDDANGGISHSEGQGYGMLLAFLAGDRAGFERIWSFTRTELLIRDDGLAAWRWDPKRTPHVTDINAASDGDILIAYALARAGRAWNEPAYLAFARRIASAVGKVTVRNVGGKLLLMPGATGFSAADRPDGPVINPSYWIFEAFPLFAQIAPDTDWIGLSRSGLAMLAATQLGPARLQPDWVSLARGAAPADGFPAVFGYNSLRIVLYLLRAGIKDTGSLETFNRNWIVRNGGVPGIVDIKSGQTLTRLTEPGYRMLGAILACALNSTAIPQDLRTFEPTLYYPSTLYLLSMAMVVERYPKCL